MTFGIYAQLIGHHFITFDDPTYIQDNPMVNRGVTLAGLAWAFTTFYAGNWHPVTWISHMIDSQLFGMFAGGHLKNREIKLLLEFWPYGLKQAGANWGELIEMLEEFEMNIMFVRMDGLIPFDVRNIRTDANWYVNLFASRSAGEAATAR